MTLHLNKKGLELAISTLILIIIGLLVLIGIAYMLTDGFRKFSNSTNSFLSTSEASSVREACKFACSAQDRFTYCCKNFTVQGNSVACGDSRLEVGCGLSCGDYSCTG